MPFRITHRQEKILEAFFHHEGYITSEYLSERLNVTPRTIRQDIKKLTIELMENGIALTAIPSKGYLLSKENIEKAKVYLDAQKPEHPQSPALPLDRYKYIIKELLFRDKTVFIQELAEKLYISSSTAEKDIQEVRKWLEEQNLLLTNERLSGFRLEGKEISFRYAMINYFWNFHNESTVIILNKAAKIFSTDITEQVNEIVYGLHDKKGIYLSDADYCNLVLYLSIMIRRIESGYEIVNDPSVPTKINKAEQDLAADITRQIKDKYAIQFPQPEIIHLGNYFKHTNIFSGTEPGRKTDHDWKISSGFITDTLLGLAKHFKLNLSEDEYLVKSLTNYSNSLIKRKGIETQVKKPPIDGISKEYPVAFEMAVAFSEIFKREFDLNLDQQEIGSIALYICAAIERLLSHEKHSDKLVVVIICATGAGGSQLLAAKARRYFKDIEIAGIYPSYRMDEARSKNPDLIVSTIPINETTYPVVQISHLLTKEDHTRVRKALDSLMAAKTKPDLVELFQADLFYPDIDTSDWREALTYVCKQIQERGYADEAFTDSVLQRESIFPTAIGNLVAIPHAFSFQKKQSWIAAGILKEPVQWGDEMVQLILLLNIDHSSGEDTKSIFDMLYEKLSTKKFVKTLIKCNDFYSFIKEINE